MSNTFLHNPGSEASHHNIVMRYWYWRIKFNFQFTLFPFHTMIWEPRTQYAGTPTTAGGSRPRTARDWPWDAAYAGPLQSCLHKIYVLVCSMILGIEDEGWLMNTATTIRRFLCCGARSWQKRVAFTFWVSLPMLPDYYHAMKFFQPTCPWGQNVRSLWRPSNALRPTHPNPLMSGCRAVGSKTSEAPTDWPVNSCNRCSTEHAGCKRRWLPKLWVAVSTWTRGGTSESSE